VRGVVLLLLLYNSSVLSLCAWCGFAFAALFFSPPCFFAAVFFPLNFPLSALLLFTLYSLAAAFLLLCCFAAALLLFTLHLSAALYRLFLLEICGFIRRFSLASGNEGHQ